MSGDFAIANGKIFTGEELLDDVVVIVGDGVVVDVVTRSQLESDIEVRIDLNGQYLVPGFIDLQVNGGGGTLFNSDPSVKGIRTIAQAHRRYGTTGFLPTLITDDFVVMREAISAVDQAIKSGMSEVLGIHLEGPFLNAERKGTHDEKKFCLLDEEGLDILTSLSSGVTLVTIAPERTTPEMISNLRQRNVLVCAGHSAADYDQTKGAIQSGLHGFTHLFNAMTPLQNREPGMVGAAIEDQNTWFGIIADGYHVHPATFNIAVKAKQKGGAILVTDAMPTVGAKDDYFELYNERIFSVNGKCTNAAGSLAGSDLNMAAAVRNATEFADIDWMEAVRMASLYPARAMGLAHCMGQIKRGYKANFAIIDKELAIKGSCHEGLFV